jgi:hypothetical protein
MIYRSNPVFLVTGLHSFLVTINIKNELFYSFYIICNYILDCTFWQSKLNLFLSKRTQINR